MNQLQESPRPREQERDFTVNVTVTVPTFRNENTSLLHAAGIGKEEQADKVDAFLFYSDDEVRIRRLSGGSVGADQRSTSTPTPAPAPAQAQAQAQVTTRKTRISFELHPSMFMEELLLSDSDESIIGNEEETAKAMNEDRFLYSISKLYANIRAPRAAKAA